MTRMLGVLGGMGPLASAHFMLRLTLLTPAERDQDHVPAVLWSDPRVPSRTVGKHSGNDPLPWLLRGIDGLQAARCGAIAIPCNTVHDWYGEMAAYARIPILHIVDATAAELHRRQISAGPVGLMATQATLNLRLYQSRLERQGWDCLIPTPDEMEGFVNPAIADVKINKVAAAYEPLAAVVQSLAARGAQAVVLGCTEIPLGIQAGPFGTLGVPLVDSVDALALAAIAWARDS
jgi:aspartate racemase